MAEVWGYDTKYFPSDSNLLMVKIFSYFVRGFKTASYLFREKPDVVWLQLPPSFLLHIAFFVRALSSQKFKIVCDMHNSAFREKWIKFPFFLTLLNKSDVIIVHNESVYLLAKSCGIHSAKLFVLEDMPVNYDMSVSRVEENTILFPCSFDVDEPVSVVVSAAKLLPWCEFIVTGDYKKKLDSAVYLAAPRNVKFVGYLSKDSYLQLLFSTTIVLGLTLRDNVQLSVANEGLSANKPLVLSDSAVLKSMFEGGGAFVDPMSAESIAGGIACVLEGVEKYRREVVRVKARRLQSWASNQALISKVLGGAGV